MASGLGKGNENHDCDLILKTMQVSIFFTYNVFNL